MQAAEALRERFGAQVSQDRGQTVAVVPRERILPALTHLRDAHGFDCLVDLTALDFRGYPDAKPGRFCVVYQLNSFKTDESIRVQAFLPEAEPEIDSAVGVWKAAGWAEREAFDLMGIRFKGHPDLRRILLPESFRHHPLRKEYPVQGLGERDAFEKYHR